MNSPVKHIFNSLPLLKGNIDFVLKFSLTGKFRKGIIDIFPHSKSKVSCLMVNGGKRVESGAVHCKKRLAIFPSPAWKSLTKLSMAGNNLPSRYVTNQTLPGRELFPARVSLVSDIPAGDGKIANLFPQCKC
jgi:hypothetical protein